MKVVNTIIKVVVALAAVAGAVYVLATYGDKIVAWAKKALASLPNCKCGEPVADADEIVAAPIAEEEPAEEPVEEAAEEAQVPAEEAAEGTVVADEADFEG